MVDWLGIEATLGQATPVVGQAPASDLARLLSEAAQAVLRPRMATTLRLRYGLERGRCRQHGYGMFIGDCHRALQGALAVRPPELLTRDLLTLADRAAPAGPRAGGYWPRMRPPSAT